MADTTYATLDMSVFFKKERGVYDNWREALWRELVQNEIDAGAKKIAITINPRLAGGCQVTFEGNGAGMTEAILRDVFFKPGATTKSGEGSIGGKGRARVLICFSQTGYRIETNDVWAAGGSYHPAGDANIMNFAMGGLTPPQPGCRVSLEIDDADPDDLRAALHRFLGQCQMDCAVTIDGQPWKDWTHRRAMTRELCDADGRRFAAIHANGGTGARYKGEVLVRVMGVTMFREYSSADQQIVVELDPARAREVLNDNRDSLRSSYRNSLQNFLDELAVDRDSAVRQQKKANYVVAGSLGRMSLTAKQALEANGGAPVAAATTGADALASPATSGGSGHYPGGSTVPEPDYAGSAPLPASTEDHPVTDRPLAGLPDIFVNLEAENKAMRQAFVRTWNPRNWVDEDGRLLGGNAVKTITLWQAACEGAISDLLTLRPELGKIRWGVGLAINDDALALHHQAEDGTHVLLVNPVTEDGLARYSVSDHADWRQMISEAYHEACHILCDWHSCEFVSLQTRLTGRMDQSALIATMKRSLADLRERLPERKSRTKEQALTQPEIAPSEPTAISRPTLLAAPDSKPWPVIEGVPLRLSIARRAGTPVRVMEGGEALPGLMAEIGFSRDPVLPIWVRPVADGLNIEQLRQALETLGGRTESKLVPVGDIVHNSERNQALTTTAESWISEHMTMLFDGKSPATNDQNAASSPCHQPERE